MTKFSNLILFLLSSILFLHSTTLLGNYTNSIVVKLYNKENLIKLNSVLNQFSDTYEVSTYINPKSLKQIDKLLQSKNFQFQKNSEYNTLGNIFQIKFQDNIKNKFDLDLISKKLSKYNIIEYASPIYTNEIVTVSPNDTLFEEQYWHRLIGTNKIWEKIDTTKKVIVAVVDTGIEFGHEDLFNQIYYNEGELGIDIEGNQKNNNGIDDDENGFVDDWRGWDFNSSNSYGYDNDPTHGHKHGTHVAGIIAAEMNNISGGVGVANNVKIMPIKIGQDFSFSTSLSNSYDGVLYAALNGAEIINCSWGSSNSNPADKEIIDFINKLGVAIIAAAGNDGEDKRFYPASYSGVVSVAATRENDKLASYSNYNTTVDISAPGSAMISSVPFNTYKNDSGTSMASPVVAGCFALMKQLFPNYSNEEILHHLKVKSENITENLDNAQQYKSGGGRIDIFNAINDTNSLKAIELIELKTNNGNSSVYSGEELSFDLSIKNIFEKIDNLNLKLYTDYIFVNSMTDSLYIGEIISKEIKTVKDIFKVEFSDTPQFDKKVEIAFDIYDGNIFLDKYFIDIIFNPSYKNLISENLKFTINSVGNLAYNDSPSNSQGIGFIVNDDNILYEAGLMLCYNDSLFDVVRAPGSIRNNGFTLDSIVYINKDENTAVSYFKTTNNEIKIIRTIIEKNSNLIYIKDEIQNLSSSIIDSFYIGNYYDWDIGSSSHDNIATYSYSNNLVNLFNIKSDTLPYVSVKTISNGFNHYTIIDNNGQQGEIGVYDGFVEQEKISALKGEYFRDSSAITDVSFVNSSGPYILEPQQSINFISIIGIGNTKVEAENIINQEITDINNSKKQRNLTILNVYPNPANESISLLLKSQINTNLSIEISDLDGKVINLNNSNIQHNYHIINDNYALDTGLNIIKIDIKKLAKGMYLLKLKDNTGELHFTKFLKVN